MVGVLLVIKQVNNKTTQKEQTQQNKTTLVQSALMTLGQETRWAYSTTLLSPRMSCLAKLSASQKVKDAVSKSVSEAQLTGLTCECSEMFSCVLDCKE